MYRYSFCEVFARKILPPLKIYIGYKLVVEHGFTQLEASKILGVKQPLINYYITGRRKPKYLDKILDIPGVKQYVDDLVDKIAEKKNSIDNLSCILCIFFRENNVLEKTLSILGYRIDEIYIPVPGAGET